MKKVKDIIEEILFGSKWLLVPFYFGLIVAQVFYCIKFVQEIIHLCTHFQSLSETQLMMVILTLIDIVMIGNLIKMTITGSYQTFIERVKEYQTEKVGSGLLKVKMGSSLIGVSSIHLLQTFINSAGATDREVIIKIVIHLVFIVSTIGLAYVDYLSHKNDHAEEKASKEVPVYNEG